MLKLYSQLGSFILLLLPVLVPATIREHQELRDIFYGEILYYAYQDDYFEAISHLDIELGEHLALDEPELDPFSWHRAQAEFAVGDLELSYRMNDRARSAIEVVLAANVEPAERNEAAYRLARLYYRKQEYINALHAIQRVEGEMPEQLVDDEAFLRAEIDVAVGNFPEAIEILQRLRGNDAYTGYVEYNLAMAYIQSGEQDKAFVILDDFGRKGRGDRAVLALRDKANIKLAYYYLDNGDPAKAHTCFARVRLEGPFSNKALLGAGWAEVAQGKYDRALVPWNLLHEREQTNISVQESMMAVPYAYGKLEVYGKSAIMYARAMDVFGTEIDSLDMSIKSIREGKFLDALVDKRAEKDPNWVVNLRNLPDSPETRYIMELMAAHDFQESLKNYKDLSSFGKYLDRWLDSLVTYEDIIEHRRIYYEPLLPEVDAEFKKLDSRIRLRIEQRERLHDRIQSLLISRRPEYLTYAYERGIIDRLDQMREALQKAKSGDSDNAYRVDRLAGLLHWRIESDYDARMTKAYIDLQDLDGVIDDLNKQYRSFVRTRQAATQSYEGYNTIQLLRTRLQAAQGKLKAIMARQGNVLETLAIAELDKRRQRLEDYQIKARFALAESYDRATRAQEKAQIEQQQARQPAVIEQPDQQEEAAQPAPEDQPDEDATSRGAQPIAVEQTKTE